MVWCEFCRDHYEEDHASGTGSHKIGREYGPTGRSMAIEELAREFVRMMDKLNAPARRVSLDL